MNAVRLIPVYVSALFLSAHFFRLSLYPLVFTCLILPFILFIKKTWAARFVQVFLLTGSAEWIRTMYFLVLGRQEIQMPWVRMAVIIGAVALMTGASALLFRLKPLRERYGLV